MQTLVTKTRMAAMERLLKPTSSPKYVCSMLASGPSALSRYDRQRLEYWKDST